MSIYQSTVTIDASPDVVWQILSAVVDWPRWMPTVTSVEALDGETLKLGHRFKVRQPKLRPATWIVSQVEPNRRFEWRASSPGMLMVADHAIEVVARGRSSVRLSFEFTGLIGSMLGLLFASTTRRYIGQEAAALKAAAERESP